MDERKATGNAAEAAVAAELTRRGYFVIARNYRKRWGEIDIVARRGREIVVCEVRSRRAGTMFDAADTVNVVKRDKIRKTAATFLENCPFPYDEVRFFVATALVAPGSTAIEIFEDAF